MLVLTWQGGSKRLPRRGAILTWKDKHKSCLFKEKIPAPNWQICEFSPFHFRGILDLWHPKVSYS